MKEEDQKKKKEDLDTWCRRQWNRIPKVIKGLLSLILLFGVGVFLFFIHGDKDQREQITFAVYLLGGGLFLLQIYISNRRVTAAEKTAEEMRKTTELTERGDIHERFKNAIEHLGDESVSIRLGGIYALHNLARDADDYRMQVFVILCTYIRETTTHKNYEPRIIRHGRKVPTIEVQSILNILFEMEHGGEIYLEFRANLEDANLAGAELVNADLAGAELMGVNLMGANLSHADLGYTILLGANLRGAGLTSASLQESLLLGADIRDADLSEVENLEIDDLVGVRNVGEAALPEDMEKELLRRNPKLLEKSDDEEET